MNSFEVYIRINMRLMSRDDYKLLNHMARYYRSYLAIKGIDNPFQDKTLGVEMENTAYVAFVMSGFIKERINLTEKHYKHNVCSSCGDVAFNGSWCGCIPF
jgi:hypothetical protein